MIVATNSPAAVALELGTSQLDVLLNILILVPTLRILARRGSYLPPSLYFTYPLLALTLRFHLLGFPYPSLRPSSNLKRILKDE